MAGCHSCQKTVQGWQDGLDKWGGGQKDSHATKATYGAVTVATFFIPGADELKDVEVGVDAARAVEVAGDVAKAAKRGLKPFGTGPHNAKIADAANSASDGEVIAGGKCCRNVQSRRREDSRALCNQAPETDGLGAADGCDLGIGSAAAGCAVPRPPSR